MMITRRTQSHPDPFPGNQSQNLTQVKIYKPSITKKLAGSDIEGQKRLVLARFKEKSPTDEAKSPQIESVVSLINGNNTFLLAGTGFGKSRVPEMFFNMFPKVSKPVVLVLNPLDTLGNNRVLEKKRIGISAINLTKTSFDSQALLDLKAHKFSFIYLSPEIFLNSESFQRLYHSSDFQSHLILKVVDEAHCIYLWGLQASGKSKNFSSHFTPQDVGFFRSSYGNLGQQLMATDHVPVLLMSATCRPLAIKGILESLKVLPKNMIMIRAELTRPEIRFIRVYLRHPLDSAEDLAGLFPKASVVRNEDMIPSLIYSGTRNSTLPVIEVVCKARGDPLDAYNGKSECIRRYHSVTGELDKIAWVEDFAEGKYPMISATSALGLGQNWKRVRLVVVMGAMDPAESNQMVGRAARGVGSEGLAILYVQANMQKGKNSIEDFRGLKNMENEDWMHAMRLTPCCIRVAYLVDNRKGYIPLSLSDPEYLKEIEREKSVNMTVCRCSNCDPQGAARILWLLPNTSDSDFDKLLDSKPTEDEDISLLHFPKTSSKQKFSSNLPLVCKAQDPIRLSIPMIDLTVSLIGNFEKLFQKTYPIEGDFAGEDVFDREEAWQIVKNVGLVANGEFLRAILGGESLPGLYEMIIQCITEWYQSPVYLNHCQELEDAQVILDQEILNEALIEEDNLERVRMKQVQREAKSNRIRADKQLRLEKQAERLRMAEEARDQRRREQGFKTPGEP